MTARVLARAMTIAATDADVIAATAAQTWREAMKCTFSESETVAPFRSLCASCFDEHNRREPEPTAVEILAMDLTDLQGDVIELHSRLSGKGKLSEAEVEAESVERKQRFERMLRLIQAALGERGR